MNISSPNNFASSIQDAMNSIATANTDFSAAINNALRNVNQTDVFMSDMVAFNGLPQNNTAPTVDPNLANLLAALGPTPDPVLSPLPAPSLQNQTQYEVKMLAEQLYDMYKGLSLSLNEAGAALFKTAVEQLGDIGRRIEQGGLDDATLTVVKEMINQISQGVTNGLPSMPSDQAITAINTTLNNIKTALSGNNPSSATVILSAVNSLQAAFTNLGQQLRSPVLTSIVNTISTTLNNLGQNLPSPVLGSAAGAIAAALSRAGQAAGAGQAETSSAQSIDLAQFAQQVQTPSPALTGAVNTLSSALSNLGRTINAQPGLASNINIQLILNQLQQAIDANYNFVTGGQGAISAPVENLIDYFNR